MAYSEPSIRNAFASSGISAPELLSVEDLPDGKVGMWLAWSAGLPAEKWPVERYATFAHQLGAGQAQWLGRVPDAGWLARNWLRQYLADRPVPGAMDWDHPIAQLWSEPTRRVLAELWERREQVLDVAEQSQRTLCHLDVWPSNLVSEGEETVLLDWSFVGEGALGEDISNLIFDTFADGIVEAELLDHLCEAVIEAYTVGLAADGWRGPREHIRDSIAATGAAKYCWFAPSLVSRVTRNAPVGNKDYGRDSGTRDMFSRLAGLMDLLASWAETTLARI